MAIENTTVIPEITRRVIERTAYIHIHTPRNNPNFTITAHREEYIQDSDGQTFHRGGFQVERRLFDVAASTIVLQNGKELEVIEIAEAISRLIDRWSQEDKDARAAIAAQQAAAQAQQN